MTPAAARADRNEAVRKAARSWWKAGVIDAATLARIEAAYPDDRVRVGPVFRVLLFLFTLVAVNGAFGFLFALAGSADDQVFPFLAFGLGVSMVFLTEYWITAGRRREWGAEAATAFMGVGYLIAFAVWSFVDGLDLTDPVTETLSFLVAALVLAVAAWRWGYWLFAGAAAAAALASLTTLPWGRFLWIALPIAAIPFLWRRMDSPRLPPAHRAGWAAVLCVALAALYVAVHLGSFEGHLVEEIGDLGSNHPPQTATGILWWLSALATGLVPVLYLAVGVRTRRYPFLLLGLGTAIVSLITLRFYIHLAPLWVVLTASGAALVATVLALRRYLDSGTGKERAGFTAEPLFQDLVRQRLLEAGAAVLSLGPAARPVHEEPKFAGGGGEFGGGGSNSEF